MGQKRMIYIVRGSTGEYSDRREWLVAAFLDGEKAKAFVDKASKFAPGPHANYRNEQKNPYDPGMAVDYTGTHYYYEPVPYLCDVPKLES